MSKNSSDKFDSNNSQEFDPAPVHSLANPELNPEQWVELFIASNSISYDYKTASIWQEGELLDSRLLLSKMRLATYKHDVPHLRQFLKDALSVWMRTQAKDHLADVREKLRFKPSDRDLIAQWVVAVTGKSDPCNVEVMRHFIWQIKRKLNNLPVEWHLMPVLFGKSGGGKSVAIQKLLEPIVSITIYQNMTVFNDQFSRRMFTSNYCMVFDEMGKSKQVDVDCLKNIITANTVEWRGIQSESIHSGKQNCTFIAASNIPLWERIKDTTSARRFWQLGCADKLNWPTINEIDYREIWQSVDENSESHIKYRLQEISEIQERDLKSKYPIEEWLGFARETLFKGDTPPTTSDLYVIFRDWCKNSEIKNIPTIQKFSKDLPYWIQTLNVPIVSGHSHKGTVWILK